MSWTSSLASLMSGTFQNVPGPQITASYVATSEQIRGSLGRNLAQGASGTATVQLVEPGTLHGERMNQVDFRVARTFGVGSMRIRGMIDLYNLLNGNAVLTVNTNYGSAWKRPTYILPARMVKFGAQVDF